MSRATSTIAGNSNEADGAGSSEWGADHVDLPAYLRRVGWSGRLEPTPEVLSGLHRAHVAAIPFEGLDPYVGRRVSVAIADVQDKLVARRRGGYCYEHGTLFGAVLERLGFEVTRVLARVGDHGDGRRPRTHLGLIVSAGGELHYADTGFGSGLLTPLPIDGSVSEQGGHSLRLAAQGQLRSFEELTPEGWTSRYRFAPDRVHASDVLVSNHYSTSHPASGFVRRLVAIRRDEQVTRQLTGHRFTVLRPDGRLVEERELSDAEVAQRLVSEFGLALTDDDLAALHAAFAADRERIGD